MRARYLSIFMVALAAFMAPQSALADLIGFERITSNASGSVGSQLQAEVTDAGGGQVDFKFTNAVGTPSSITDIYFDDDAGVLADIAAIFVSGAGVAFSEGSSPPDLPGGNNASPAFHVTVGLSADSDSPVSQNGVNSSTEWVTLRLNLTGGTTFADVIDALAAAGGEGLRIGLHVQAINANGNEDASDGYINTPPRDPPPPIPAPGAAVLAMIGMGLVGRLKRTIV